MKVARSRRLSPSVTLTSLMLSRYTASSLMIVPTPCPSATGAPTTFDTLKKKVSFDSSVVSPVMLTTKVLRGLPGRERGRAAVGGVIAAGGRRVVGGGIVERDELRAGQRQADGEGGGGRAAVALQVRTRRSPTATWCRRRGSCRTPMLSAESVFTKLLEDDEEGLVRLIDLVAVDGDADRLARLAGGEDHDAAGRGIVRAGGRGVVASS